MADKNLASLTLATTAALTDFLYLVIGGNSRRITLGNLRTAMGVHPQSLASSTGTTYAPVTADFVGGVFRTMTNAADITVTVPSGLTAPEVLTLSQGGAGQVILVAGGGVTLRSADTRLTTRVQYSTVSLIPVGTDIYQLVGDIVT